MVTREEYKFLKKIKSEGYKWIARDKNWKLFIYQEMPRRNRTIWNFGGVVVNIRGEYFTFIKWEDEEPTSIADLINEYEQHETLKRKAVIPQYVADWIEYVKDMERPIKLELLFYTLSMPIEVREWLIKDDINTDILVRAWLDGYEVETEKLYTVRLKNGYHLCKYEGTGVRWLNMTEFNTEDCYKLTKSEIESVDPRLMQFAEEVE